jgi:amino acid permease
MWDQDLESGLTSLCLQSDEQDAITKFINSIVLPCHQRLFGHRNKHRLHVTDPFTRNRHQMPVDRYPDATILSFVNTASTILSSLIPAICTLALYFIDSALARMGALVAFTFLFSTTLSLITNVKRSECFGITAAFSAVLVVFVGNNINASY